MRKTPLKKISKRLSSGLYKYEKAKKEYLEEHLSCERCCRYAILQLHHRAGREASLLWDKKHFAALCLTCHAFCHTNPKQAREEGWMLDRLTINNGCYE